MSRFCLFSRKLLQYVCNMYVLWFMSTKKVNQRLEWHIHICAKSECTAFKKLMSSTQVKTEGQTNKTN